MSKVSGLTVEAATMVVNKVEGALHRALSSGGITASASMVRDVGRVLGFTEGVRGKGGFKDGYPTVQGCRFAVDKGGADISPDTIGAIIAEDMAIFGELMGEQDALTSKLGGIQAALTSIGGDEAQAPTREALTAQKKEYQEQLDAVRKRLRRYGEAFAAHQAQQKAENEAKVSQLTEEVKGLEKAVKNAPALENLLQVKRNDLAHAQGKLAALTAMTASEAPQAQAVAN